MAATDGGGVALVLEQLPFSTSNLLIFWTPRYNVDAQTDTGRWLDSLKEQYSDYMQIGQIHHSFSSQLDDLIMPNATCFDEWTLARQKMLISPEPSQSPNILFLDAEERRWVTPKHGLGEIRSEDMEQRWLSSYCATENWDGQVESALLAMKISSDERFSKLVDDMNSFLSGKEILKKVILGKNRLRVQLANGNTHSIDELSAGEHQVLIQLYMVDRWMERGGIVMIDEPDLYLHPSLISGFLAQLEKMVAARDGQLMITSHVPDVWSRYEAIGQRVLLGAKA